MSNNVILFDIDYTLFNTELYRDLVFHQLHAFFPESVNFNEIATEAYAKIRETGWFEIPKFTTELLTHFSKTVDKKLLEDVWKDKAILGKALYPEAIDVLTSLSKSHATLGIFSSGFLDFQKAKIVPLGHLFAEEHLHIHILKDEKMPEIIKKYQGKKIILIDDYIPVIEKAKKADPHITTIWIKRGRLADKVAPTADFPPDFIIENLKGLIPIVEKELPGVSI